MKKQFIRLAIAGPLFILCAAAQAGQLVTNGGFETGDLTGWFQSGDRQAFVVTSPVNSGSYSVKMTPGSTDNLLLQAITTVVGQSYIFSVDVINEARPADNSDLGRFYWNGLLIPGAPTFEPGDNLYHQYSFSEVATDTTTVIGFEGHNSFGNIYADDFSVQPAPEPSSIAFGILALGSMAVFVAKKR